MHEGAWASSLLRLLLDEHLSPAVATELAKACPGLDVVALRDWIQGASLAADDAAILIAARSAGLSLVTCDLRTIPPLLNAWTEQGERHGGVVFVHSKTLRSSDVGGLVRALTVLWLTHGGDDWTDRVMFLRP